MTITTVTVRAATLETALKGCLLATGTDRMLPVLGTLRLASDGETLTIDGTNRFMAARAEIQLPTDTEQGKLDVLVGAGDVKRIASLLREYRKYSGAEVSLTYDDETGFLRVSMYGERDFTIRPFTEGQFPNMDRFFEHVPEQVAQDAVRIDPRWLAALAKMPRGGKLEGVSLTFHGAGKPIRCTWDTAGDGLVFSVTIMPTRQ